ncbi:hypothetical protein AAULR_06859 [Lacticaseibacillus rhamnosus MTCC 5462]|nr:hypothetical protein AAULR_06859 [Lacticaseibacillus rhamnosus MTCC 5462]
MGNRVIQFVNGNGHEVDLWSHNPKQVATMQETRKK